MSFFILIILSSSFTFAQNKIKEINSTVFMI